MFARCVERLAVKYAILIIILQSIAINACVATAIALIHKEIAVQFARRTKHRNLSRGA